MSNKSGSNNNYNRRRGKNYKSPEEFDREKNNKTNNKTFNKTKTKTTKPTAPKPLSKRQQRIKEEQEWVKDNHKQDRKSKKKFVRPIHQSTGREIVKTAKELIPDGIENDVRADGKKRYPPRLRNLLTDITAHFRIMKKNNHVLSEKKQEKNTKYEETTYEKYRDIMQDIAVRYFEQYRKVDLDYYNMMEMYYKEIDQFFVDYKHSTPGRLNLEMCVIDSYQKFLPVTEVRKNKEPLLSTEEIRFEMVQLGVKRTIDGSRIAKCHVRDAEKIAETIKYMGYGDKKMRRISHQFISFSAYTGGRVSNSLLIDADAIDLDNRRVYFIDDKGGKNRFAYIYDDKGLEFLRELKEEAKAEGRTRLFNLKITSGDEKAIDQARREISKYVSEARKACGLTFETTDKVPVRENGKLVGYKEMTREAFFTNHSARKAYAQDLAHYYLKEIRAGRFNYHFNRQMSNEKMIDGSKGEHKYKKKYDTAIMRKYHYKMDDKKWEKGLTDHEKALYLASVDLGHYRTDVLKHYLSIQEFKKK